jgi:hypothetical protein
MLSFESLRRFRLTDLQPMDWLRLFALLTWLATVLPLALLPLLVEEMPSLRSLLGMWSAAFLFLLALFHPAIRRHKRSSLWVRIAVVLLMSVSAFAVSYFTRSGMGSLLAVIVAAFLPWLLPMIVGVAWVIFLAMAFGVWILFVPDGSWVLGLVYFFMNLGLTLFPFIASTLALSQMQARSELRRVQFRIAGDPVAAGREHPNRRTGQDFARAA